jgi:SAM-dependent methyltransferase
VDLLPLEVIVDPIVARQAREKAFWDRFYSRDMYANWQEKPFEVWQSALSTRKGPLTFLGPVAGRRLLLCGVGQEAVVFARAGAEVYGFDISCTQIEAVQALARRAGLSHQIHVQAMPFEALTYQDEFFDLAYGAAILHHIDIAAGSVELARVLRPGGRAAFVEPLATNPLLRFARCCLPYREKHRTPDERPLTYQDIEVFSRNFAMGRREEMVLFAMLQRRIVTQRRVIQWLECVDRILLEKIPMVRSLCAQVWLGVQKGVAALVVFGVGGLSACTAAV